MKTIATILAAASLVAFAAPASASVIVGSNSYDVGESFVVNFDGNSDSTPIPGLTAQLTVTFAGIVGGDYSFTYTLLNNSSITSRVTGFAFDTDPNVSGGTASGLFGNLVTFNQPGNQSYPNGVGAVEVCLQSGGGGNSCAGGGNGGVWNGTSGNGSFTLDFANVTPDNITLSDFYDRYQSLQVGSGSGTGTGTPGDPLPEPGTWALMLLGFGATGVAMRRSRRRKELVTQFA